MANRYLSFVEVSKRSFSTVSNSLEPLRSEGEKLFMPGTLGKHHFIVVFEHDDEIGLKGSNDDKMIVLTPEKVLGYNCGQCWAFRPNPLYKPAMEKGFSIKKATEYSGSWEIQTGYNRYTKSGETLIGGNVPESQITKTEYDNDDAHIPENPWDNREIVTTCEWSVVLKKGQYCFVERTEHGPCTKSKGKMIIYHPAAISEVAAFLSDL